MSTDRESGRGITKKEVESTNKDEVKRQTHGHGKREVKENGKSDKRITESNARQNEALHCAQTIIGMH
jgi:hypothetical protein